LFQFPDDEDRRFQFPDNEDRWFQFPDDEDGDCSICLMTGTENVSISLMTRTKMVPDPGDEDRDGSICLMTRMENGSNSLTTRTETLLETLICSLPNHLMLLIA
jgi:hypothetical protein